MSEEKPKEDLKEEEQAKEDKKSVEDEVKGLVDKFVKGLDAKLEEKLSNITNNKMVEPKTAQILGKEEVEKMDKSTRAYEFIKALIRGEKEKIQPLSEGTAADGGFLVPEEWANDIIEDMRDMFVIEQRARVIPMTTDHLHLPALDHRPKAQWRSELAVKSTSTAEWTEIELTPYSLAAIIPLSEELVDDASIGASVNMVSYVGGLLARALGEAKERAFILGTGTGQPTGIQTGTPYGHTVNAGGALAYAHLNRAYWNLPQGYRRNAVWIMNSRTIAEVKGFTDTANRPIFVDALTVGGLPTLLGAPVLEQNDLGSQFAYFCDLNYYVIGARQGITVRSSNEATVASYSAFERDMVHVKAQLRVDGEVALTDAFSEITNTGVA